jgi:hypothetical protein
VRSAPTGTLARPRAKGFACQRSALSFYPIGRRDANHFLAGS